MCEWPNIVTFLETYILGNPGAVSRFQVMIRAGEFLGMKDVFSKLQNFQDYGTS